MREELRSKKIRTKAKHLSCHGTKASSGHLAVCGLPVSACMSMIHGTSKERMIERGLG